jgi:hypothetical protein
MKIKYESSFFVDTCTRRVPIFINITLFCTLKYLNKEESNLVPRVCLFAG